MVWRFNWKGGKAMKRVFRPIEKKEFQEIANVVAREIRMLPFLDKVAIRSMLMDECNVRGIKWYGKENASVIPELVKLSMKRARL